MRAPRPNDHAWLNRPGVKDALAQGLPPTQVAKLAGVTYQTVQQYVGRYLKPALAMATQAACFEALRNNETMKSIEIDQSFKTVQAAALGSEFLSRSNEIWNLAMEGARNLHKQKKFQATAPLLGQANANLRMYGEHTGALNGAIGNVTNVVLLLPQTHVVDQAETIEGVVIDDESTN